MRQVVGMRPRTGDAQEPAVCSLMEQGHPPLVLGSWQWLLLPTPGALGLSWCDGAGPGPPTATSMRHEAGAQRV